MLPNDKLESLSNASKGTFKEIKDFKLKKLQVEEDSNIKENVNMDKMELIMKNIELMKNTEEIFINKKEINSSP